LLVERGHEVVANVGTDDELLEAVDAFTPDVATVALRRSHPGVGVLVFSYGSKRVAPPNLLAGNPEGVGHLFKYGVTDIAEFDDALHRVASGGTALDPEAVPQLIGSRH
jgi:hypothetical protein